MGLGSLRVGEVELRATRESFTEQLFVEVTLPLHLFSLQFSGPTAGFLANPLEMLLGFVDRQIVAAFAEDAILSLRKILAGIAGLVACDPAFLQCHAPPVVVAQTSQRRSCVTIGRNG